jgi:hypothetical protein
MFSLLHPCTTYHSDEFHASDVIVLLYGNDDIYRPSPPPTMRLLKLTDDGHFSLVWFPKDKIPPYAILSHTWGRGEDDEVTFRDLTDGTGKNKRGFQKLRFCGNQAKADDLHYFWVDTCCIDKSNNNELTTAINSMFRWYQIASRCYVYLSDVSVQNQDGQFHLEWESAFRNSRWFTRGWTLQELLAPKIVEFYSRDHVRLGDKRSLMQQIHEATGIAIEALQGRHLGDFSVEERLIWGKKRQTTEEEDEAYFLLGIFGVFMPLIYGEGQVSATRRLLREIEGSSQSRSQLLSKIPIAYSVSVTDHSYE